MNRPGNLQTTLTDSMISTSKQGKHTALINGSNPERKTRLSKHLKQKQPESAKEKADSQKDFSVTRGLKATVHNTQNNNITLER